MAHLSECTNTVKTVLDFELLSLLARSPSLGAGVPAVSKEQTNHVTRLHPEAPYLPFAIHSIGSSNSSSHDRRREVPERVIEWSDV
jgi:hypothetical protein